MMRKILAWFGYGVRYRDNRGVYTHRYDYLDYVSMRPTHETMSVAYMDAKREFYRLPHHS
jgi:hypothetical protein